MKQKSFHCYNDLYNCQLRKANNDIKGIQLSKHNTKLYLYADDVLLFLQHPPLIDSQWKQ